MNDCDECRRLRKLIKIRQDDRYAVGELAEAEREYSAHLREHIHAVCPVCAALRFDIFLNDGDDVVVAVLRKRLEEH